MPYTIAIDAGHGGSDPGAVYEGRREKDDNLSLAIAVGELLSRQGVSVIYTRTTDVYQTPFEKAQMANQADADFFISFHRNSSEDPNQYTGVETLVYDNSGIKQTMAENINGALSELGFRNLGVKARPGLVVLRRTKMPALLIETGFLNNEQDNTLYDEKQEEIARAIADAWRETGLDTDRVYFNAHGTGTPMNDRIETLAIKKALGEDRARRITISSTKSMTGHMLGAAGGAEAVASVLALRDGIAPPTINLTQPDPDCDLDYTPLTAKHADFDVALSSSLGFGGHNACLAFRKWED